jgi:hypothetical protein
VEGLNKLSLSLKEAQKAYFIAFEFKHGPLESLLDVAQLSFRLAISGMLPAACAVDGQCSTEICYHVCLVDLMWSHDACSKIRCSRNYANGSILSNYWLMFNLYQKGPSRTIRPLPAQTNIPFPQLLLSLTSSTPSVIALPSPYTVARNPGNIDSLEGSSF